MTLREKQSLFARKIAELVLWAYEQGYEVTYGDFFRDPRVHGVWGVTLSYSHPYSRHKLKLAADLNLFKDGAYLTSTEDHRPLGEKWEEMGGTWGGRWNDGNHYSWEEY